MTPEEIGPHTRALLDNLLGQRRVLITDPDNVARVAAAVEELDRGPLIEVRSSPYCPPGKILVVESPMMPSMPALQEAGVDAQVARIRAQAEAEICRTRGGRLAWRIAGRVARWRIVGWIVQRRRDRS